jgi:hypothetical protein
MPNQFTAKLLVTDTTAQCSKCKQHKLFSEFHIGGYKHRHGCAYYCKECACVNSRKNHNERMLVDKDYAYKKKMSYYKTKYGLTEQEYLSKRQAQKTCAICNKLLKKGDPNVHLDHNHTTGKIRDFLCTNCNRGLGHFHEDINKMKSAIKYLNKHRRFT